MLLSDSTPPGPPGAPGLASDPQLRNSGPSLLSHQKPSCGNLARERLKTCSNDSNGKVPFDPLVIGFVIGKWLKWSTWIKNMPLPSFVQFCSIPSTESGSETSLAKHLMIYSSRVWVETGETPKRQKHPKDPISLPEMVMLSFLSASGGVISSTWNQDKPRNCTSERSIRPRSCRCCRSCHALSSGDVESSEGCSRSFQLPEALRGTEARPLGTVWEPWKTMDNLWQNHTKSKPSGCT